MTPTPAVINVPPTKAALAAEVENILGRLRRGYISQLHAPSLPPIEPEVWAANRRAGWLACLQDPAPEKAPPGPGAQLFPSAADFDALDQSVEILARAMGVRRFRHQDRLQIYRRVEHDYPRLKVIGFAHDLARRIGSVPEPPSRSWRSFWQSNALRRQRKSRAASTSASVAIHDNSAATFRSPGRARRSTGKPASPGCCV